MKRLIYTFLVLLFSLQGAMAYDLPVGRYVYFANTDNWTTSTIQFMIGHKSWSQGFKMTKISNTNLYYYKHTGTAWNGYTQWAVFGTSGVWYGEDNSITHRKSYADKSTSVGSSELSSTYNLIPTTGTTLSKNSSYSSLLNKTHTIKLYVDDVESAEGGSVSASSYKLSSASATSATSGTTSIEAAYTATIKLTATANAGYEFVGWYEGTTLKSSSTTYSYTAPNSVKTISAKFKKLEAAAPQITSFTASASEIDLGESVTFSVEVENAEVGDVVFKNGDETITNPWTPTAGGEYTITANLDGATSKSVNLTVYAATIYFDNTISGWSNVYAYCWTDGDKNAEWPGVELTNPTGNIYTYKTIKSYKNIIFTNNSGAQTADLEFVNDSTYSMPEPAPFVAGTENLCGSSWNATDEKNKMAEVEGATDLFSKIYSNLAAGDYQFKVVYEGGWLGYDKLDTENSTKGTENKDGNIGFTLIDKANVTISYNVATKKIVITAAGIDNFGYTYFPVGEKIYLSSDKGASRYAAYLYGPGDKNTWADVAATDYKNIYSLTVPEGEWNGLIFCAMKKGSTTNDWNNKDAQTADLRYEGDNWHFWGTKEGVSSYWRKYENLILAGQKLYFKPDSNWEAKNTRFAAYYWDILGENAWADCVYNEEKDVYEVVAPTSGSPACAWTNMKFVRINPKYTDNAWNDDKVDDRVWNETENLVFDGVNDLFIIKLTKKLEGTENLDWNSADVNNWISFSHLFKGAVFFEPNAKLKATAAKRFSIYLWNGFDENCWVKMQPMATHPDIYCAVIPKGYWTGANICSMNPATETDSWNKKGDEYIHVLNQTDNLTYHGDKLLYKAPETWNFKVPADECWTKFESDVEDKTLGDDIACGVYFQVFKYTKTIAGEEVNNWHWISLPFDAKISDIEGGVFGSDFIVQDYDTEARSKWTSNVASKNESAWRMMGDDETLLAGRGYILAVNNEKSSYTLTFVSKSDLNIVSNQFDGVNTNYSSDVAESANWHLIGTGLYGAIQSYSGVNYVAVPDGDDYKYYNLSEQGLTDLAAYGAFFVQYAGDYSFSKEATVKSMAPRRAIADVEIETFNLVIAGNDASANTTVYMAEDGGDEYVVGKDFLHLGASGSALQLYTKQGENDLSFNYLKREDCTIALGGYVAQSGKHTISLSSEVEASSVLLLDNTTGVTTDLLNNSYEFDAEKGSIDGRFNISVVYAVQDDTPTSVETAVNSGLMVLNSDEIVIFEGLTVGAEVVIYDVMGRCVSRFEATEDVVNMVLDAGIYVLHHNAESVKFIVE